MAGSLYLPPSLFGVGFWIEAGEIQPSSHMDEAGQVTVARSFT